MNPWASLWLCNILPVTACIQMFDSVLEKLVGKWGWSLLDSNMHYGFSPMYVDARIKFPSFVCIHVWGNSVLSFWINHLHIFFFCKFCHFLYFLFGLAVIFLILCNLLSFSLKPFETYNTCEPQSNAFEEFFLKINSFDFFLSGANSHETWQRAPST